MLYNPPTWENDKRPAVNDENLNVISKTLQQDGIEIANLQTSISSPYNFKGNVSTVANLPSTGNTVNDTYYVTSAMQRYTWNGNDWYPSSLSEADYTDLLGDATDRIEELEAATEMPILLSEYSFVYGSVVNNKPSITTTKKKPVARTGFLHLKAGSVFSVSSGWVCAAWRFDGNGDDAVLRKTLAWSSNALTADEDGWWIIGISTSASASSRQDLTGRLAEVAAAFTGTIVRVEAIGDAAAELEAVTYAPLPPERAQFFEKGGNLFDGTNVITGRYLDAGGDAVVDATSQYTEDYIPVHGGMRYAWTAADGLLICTYDANYTGLERHGYPYAKGTPDSIVFDSNVEYVRLSTYQHSFPEHFMFCRGQIPAEYIGTKLEINANCLPAERWSDEDLSGQMFYSFDPTGGTCVYADGTTRNSGTSEAFVLYLPMGGDKHIQVTYMRDVDLRTTAMEYIERDGETVHVDSYRDKDVWRLHQGIVGHVVRQAGQYAFEPDTVLIRNGAWETAIYYSHTPWDAEHEDADTEYVTDKAVGTFHGYERLSSASFAVDGTAFEDLTQTVGMTKCELFTANTVSVIHVRDHDDEKLADAVRNLRVENGTIQVSQRLTWAKAGTTAGSIRAYLAMGCARRRSEGYDLDADEDRGDQITDLAACDGPVPIYPDATWTEYTYQNAEGQDVVIHRWTPSGTPIGKALGQVYDVSKSYHRTAISGNSDNSGITGVRRARLWGAESGLSVEIDVDFDNRFYVSCNPAFNKLYFRKGDGETVDQGDVWNTVSRFRFAAGK